jgi:hypothetical protein
MWLAELHPLPCFHQHSLCCASKVIIALLASTASSEVAGEAVASALSVLLSNFLLVFGIQLL